MRMEASPIFASLRRFMVLFILLQYAHEVFTEEDIKKANEQQPHGTQTAAGLRSFALYKNI
jgi:hypothetical protein